MPIIDDPRYTQSAIAGPVNSGLMMRPQQEEDEPAAPLMDTLGAAARQSTLVGAGYERLMNRDPDLPDAPLGWDPLDHIKGYEDHAQALADATTPSELAGRLSRINAQRVDLQVLNRSGLGGPGAQLLMNLFDPTFLVAVAVPELAPVKATRMTAAIRGALSGAATVGAYEAGMQALQEDRSATESLFNVGGGALLGGMLGSLLHRATKPEIDAVRAALDSESRRSTGGAAATMRESTMEREALAAGGRQLSKGMSKVPLLGTDLDHVLASDSVVANQVLGELADIPGILGKNLQGEASPVSVESLVARHDARIADFSDQLKNLWAEYRTRVPRGTRMSQGDFHTAVASAARRDDTIGIPEVDKAAKFLREHVFDPLKKDAMDLGLLDDPVKLAQARIEKKAVEKYVKAETKQIYTDYLARTRQAIAESDPAALVRGTSGLTGDTLTAAERGAAIRTELERALSVESDTSARMLADIDARVADAERAFDAELAGLAKEKELSEAALEAENLASKEVASTAGKKRTEDASLELARALATERQIQSVSVDKAEAILEAARRGYQTEISRTKRDLTGATGREARLRAKIALKDAEKARAVAIEEAKTNFERNRGRLVAKHGKESVKAAGKLARQAPSLRSAFEYGRNTERARSKLQLQRNAATTARGAERRRLSEAQKKLKGKAQQSFDKIAPVSRAKFLKRAQAVARGGTDESAEVNKLAKLLRDQQAGTLAGRVTVPQVEERYIQSVVGASSYFRRMYDREVIRGNLPEWRQILKQWFTREGNAVEEEVDAAIEDVTRKILGADVGQSNFATKISVSKAGPLQERTLDIPDALIEKFLVNDPMKVARAYVKDLAPQVEMARKFGDVDMKQQVQSISDDYSIKRKQVEGSRRTPENKAKELARLQQQETEALEALVRIRDRILNRAGRLGPDASEGTRRAVAASRAWRNWVASARLGGTAITGGTMDVARIAAQYGFFPTMKKAAQLVSSSAFRDLSRTQARRVGSAVEVALSRRVTAAYDGAVTEGWTEKLANGVYKYTGLNHITDFNRTLSATLLEDAVLKASQKVAAGETLPKFHRARLASLGIGDDELRRIAEQVQQHGGEVDGIRVSGSADWEDKALADIYDAAILRESKIVVQQPGAADRVWWMDSETGKLIGQLKSFALSGPARLLTLPAQALGQGNFGYAARFMGYMMLGGYLTHSLRQVVAGKAPTTDPKQAAVEAVTESGVMGVIPDLLSPVGRRMGFGESVRLADRNVLSAYGGPALGAFGDVYDFAMNKSQGGISANDLHMLRRMLPFNNVWYLRREINALEGETAEALDLQGADNVSILERIGRTDAMLPEAKRGGTGTGVLQ